MYIFVVANQKGGVGKTTTCVSVGAALARRGRTVLLVDNDPQGHVGRSLGLGDARAGGTTSLYLERKHRVADVLERFQSAGRETLRVIASTSRLSEAERDAANDLSGGLYRLADRAEGFAAVGTEFIMVDCPPNLGALALNAFVLASELAAKGWKGGVVVPVGMGVLDVDGLGRLSHSLDALQTRGLAPGILGLVPTMCEPQTLITKDVLNVLHERYDGKVTTMVRKSIRFREAPATGQTIFEYDPDGYGAEDYDRVATELVKLADGYGEE
jgi:chromosome partitioning protein